MDNAVMTGTRRGQAVIEMTIAIVVSIVLMLSTIRIWAWMVTTLVERQEAYQATRLSAGRHTSPGCPNYYRSGKLSVFGEFSVPGQRYSCQ